ncbi:L-fuculose-phosphate aldolase [Acidaminobacter sp. JC074]|uniref:L-fuculose-phosphate aldolase n=1 Tax=Acidaminobacter sp. JC074 TaxID=2530199 RepID=UPI001F0FE3E5|nr:L-fuculose-phosphate aldolase [Acidaminobacter sp. JC074]MCH4887683.1 L-fuculose-phosphate aldolase [Acidaminobacter sp. JC074]
MLMEKERQEIVYYGKQLLEKGLTTGSGGNLSIYNRDKGLMAISPTGIPYFEMKKEDVVIMDLEGKIIDGNRYPSSEHEMHAIVYRNRQELNAMVHTHSIFAATISALNQPLPAVDYLVAIGGGKDVKCAKYATYGSEALAINALEAMEGRNAVLLANHGMNACSTDLKKAMNVAEQLEFCSEIYVRAKSMGEKINIIDDEEMIRNVKKFVTYGVQK